MGGRRRSLLGGQRVPDHRGPAPRLATALATKLTLEYDGAGFAGWATQPGQRTVQEELEAALARVRRSPVSLTVAGRTDGGVHARGQVASHPGPPSHASQLNGVLPDDVRVLRSEEVPDDFDARRDALSRTYRYRVQIGQWQRVHERGRSWHWRYALDREALDACAALVPGTHDFTAFTRTKTIHRHFHRTVRCSEWAEEPGQVLAYRVEADAFMRSMVRILVGTMVTVATGRLSLDAFAELLEGRPRVEAGDTAPAHGLYLEGVRYAEGAP